MNSIYERCTSNSRINTDISNQYISIQQIHFCLLAVNIRKERNVHLLAMFLSEACSKCSTNCLLNSKTGILRRIPQAADTDLLPAVKDAVHGHNDGTKEQSTHQQRTACLLACGWRALGCIMALRRPFPVPHKLFGALRLNPHGQACIHRKLPPFSDLAMHSNTASSRCKSYHQFRNELLL